MPMKTEVALGVEPDVGVEFTVPRPSGIYPEGRGFRPDQGHYQIVESHATTWEIPFPFQVRVQLCQLLNTESSWPDWRVHVVDTGIHPTRVSGHATEAEARAQMTALVEARSDQDRRHLDSERRR